MSCWQDPDRVRSTNTTPGSHGDTLLQRSVQGVENTEEEEKSGPECLSQSCRGLGLGGGGKGWELGGVKLVAHAAT